MILFDLFYLQVHLQQISVVHISPESVAMAALDIVQRMVEVFYTGE
jgi:hypothetical protein